MSTLVSGPQTLSPFLFSYQTFVGRLKFKLQKLPPTCVCKPESGLWARDMSTYASCTTYNVIYEFIYRTPVMGLVVNLTAINDYPVSNSFSIEITCGIDLSVVGLTNLPADPSRLYEIPRDASVSISVEL